MSDDVNAADPEPQSKFEWRPDDITILSDEEGDAAEAEYAEWRAELAKAAATDPAQDDSE